ncbi:hypothetical protein [Flexivirga meconopsidis]|uniref:hypothetical protein n=1 Tax=Flexivirga meconopsidis TaxID=2977121 RepID=UPI00223FEFBC|nr:hypothetical protein [Flexivirga meconopsidis]
MGGAKESSGISRRKVAKSAAWSVPAVALAGGAPAASASPGCSVTVCDVCAVCVSATSVRLDFTVQNDSAEQVVTINSIKGPGASVWSGLPTQFTAPPGRSIGGVTVSVALAGDGAATITYSVCGQTRTASVDIRR